MNEQAVEKTLVEKRIGKYEHDLARHVAPSQADGICKCPACIIDRGILAELKYMQMVERISRRAQSLVGVERASPPMRAREEIAREVAKIVDEPLGDGALAACDYMGDEAADDLRKAITRALFRTAGQEWRDISSAPKDARDLWLWKSGWDKAVLGGWISKSATNNDRAVWMLYGGRVVEPTHWHPYHRPAPPVAEPIVADIQQRQEPK